MQLREPDGDPTTAGLVTGGVVVLVILGGTAAGATTTDHTAPILALVGAVFVALLTAVTTNRRQRRQLDAEDRRLRRQLDGEDQRLRRQLRAEDRRLASQLTHDRELTELERLREFFDDAAAVFERWLRAGDDYLHVLRNKPDDHDAAISAASEAAEAYAEMNLLARRMAFRLPVDHPVYRAYSKVSDLLHERSNRLDDTALEGGEDWQPDDAQTMRVMQAWRRFVDLAREELDRRAAVAR